MKKMFILVAGLAGTLLLASCGPPPVVGTWQGKLDAGQLAKGIPALQGKGVQVKFTIEQKDGKLSGRLHLPEQGNYQAPVETVTYEKGQVHLESRSLYASFDGKLQGRKIVGEWKQGPAALPLTLEKQ